MVTPANPSSDSTVYPPYGQWTFCPKFTDIPGVVKPPESDVDIPKVPEIFAYQPSQQASSTPTAPEICFRFTTKQDTGSTIITAIIIKDGKGTASVHLDRSKWSRNPRGGGAIDQAPLDSAFDIQRLLWNLTTDSCKDFSNASQETQDTICDALFGTVDNLAAGAAKMLKDGFKIQPGQN